MCYYLCATNIMIEQLFGSKTRVKLLKLFFSNPNRSFYVREITRKIDEQINSVRRELSNLLSIGIITSDNSNNRLYYEVNQKYEYYKELSGIFGNTKVKTGGQSETGKENGLKDMGSVDLLLLTGSFTRDNRAGIDVLIVGDVNLSQTAKYISNLEQQEGRELTYAVLGRDEFDYRKKIKDRFVSNILSAKVTIVHDSGSLIFREEKLSGN